MGDYSYIRHHYGLTLKTGDRVSTSLGEGQIVSPSPHAVHYARVQIDGEDRSRSFHPLDVELLGQEDGGVDMNSVKTILEIGRRLTKDEGHECTGEVAQMLDSLVASAKSRQAAQLQQLKERDASAEEVLGKLSPPASRSTVVAALIRSAGPADGR